MTIRLNQWVGLNSVLKCYVPSDLSLSASSVCASSLPLNVCEKRNNPNLVNHPSTPQIMKREL